MNKYINYKEYLFYFGLFFISLLFLSVYNSVIPATDPVETNYALAAKEMFLKNDWSTPVLYGKVFFDKPIMLFWCLLISYKIFGITDFAMRFPSAFFSALTICLTYFFAKKITGSFKVAIYSSLCLITSLVFWIIGRLVLTDMVLLFFNTLALVAFYLSIQSPVKDTKKTFLAWGAMAFATLTKGPVGFLLPLAVLFVFFLGKNDKKSSWQKINFWQGSAFFLILTLPWFTLMYHTYGIDFVKSLFGLHNVTRAVVSEHPDDNVFYYYFLLLPVYVLPWTGIFLRSLWRTLRYRESCLSAKYLYLIIIVYILFYTFMATKYPTYILPLVFPVTIIMGYELKKMESSNSMNVWHWLTWSIVFFNVVLLIAGKEAYLFSENIFNIRLALVINIIFTLLWQWQRKKQILLYYSFVTTFLLILYILPNFFLPLAKERSTRDLVSLIPKNENNLSVAAFGDFSTSAILYSGYNMPLLMHDVWEEDVLKNDKWAGKYTMRRLYARDFIKEAKNNEKDIYIIARGQAKEEFLKQGWAKGFEAIATNTDVTIFFKDKRKDLEGF